MSILKVKYKTLFFYISNIYTDKLIYKFTKKFNNLSKLLTLLS